MYFIIRIIIAILHCNYNDEFCFTDHICKENKKIND